MPYSAVSELPDAVKNLPKGAQEIYMKAFNSAFEQNKGEDGREPRSHAAAWASVKRSYKQVDGNWVAKEAVHPHGEHVCVCPECGKEITVAENVKCNTQKCPECETQLRAKDIGEFRNKPKESLQAIYSEVIQEAGRRNASLDSSRLKKIVELCQDMLSSEEADEDKTKSATKEAESVLVWLREQASTKTEEGAKYPASAFAYAPEADQPAGWKLRLWEDPDKKVTKTQLAKASAALSPGGYRGQKVAVASEDLPAVKRAIRAEYRKLGVEEKEIPKWVKETMTRDLARNVTPLTEATFDKGKATVIVIKAGFNADRSRYYPADMLKQCFGVFEGQKMFADHPTEAEDKDLPERSIKSGGWVATLTEVKCDDDGTVTGVAEIVETWLMQKLALLRDKGMLSEMGISINALGNGEEATIEDTKTLVIDELTGCRSVDFVTYPGAGGAVTLYESDRQNDIDLIGISVLRERRPDLVETIEAEAKATTMKEVKKLKEGEDRITELEGENQTLTTERDEARSKLEEAEKAQAKAEAQAVIKAAVDQAELPEAAKARLMETFKDDVSADGIDAAIQAEVDYIAKLSEAGKVKGMGPTKSDPAKDEEALKESAKRTHPEYTDEQIETFVTGR